MHVSIIDSMMHACVMHVKNGDGRTDEQTDGKLNSRSRMPIHMKHVSMMHACVRHVKNGDERTNGRTNGQKAEF